MATSHDRYLCKSFSRYKWSKTLNHAGAPWARLRSASRRRRIAHADGVILAQEGSWRFFDRGGEGGDAGRVFTKILAGHFGLGLGIARALGVGGRRISGL